MIEIFYSFTIKERMYKVNHHQKLSHSYISVMFSTIKTPISFASEQLKTSTYGKRTNHI